MRRQTKVNATTSQVDTMNRNNANDELVSLNSFDFDTTDETKLIKRKAHDSDNQLTVDEESEKKSTIPNVRKDLYKIFLLIFLYLLQGVPIGLTGSIPYILSSRKVSYTDQGTFSFALWPFSLKLLWAPIVDSVYFKRIGRRKSWLVPIQYLLGLFMILFANYVHELLDQEKDGSHSGIYPKKTIQNLPI